MSDGWSFDNFGCLLQIPTRNGLHKGPRYQGRGTPVVKMGEVYHEQHVGPAERDRFDLSSTEVARFRLQRDDLLFCRTSLVAAGVGRCAIVGNVPEDTVFASNLIRARLNPQKASASFYRYFFNSPVGRGLMQSIARGTTVTTITGPDIAALRVPIPPLDEQHRIAKTLGVLDSKIQLNRRMNRTLESIAHASFKSWFIDFDPVRKKMEGGDPGLPPDLAALFPNSLEESVLGRVPSGWPVFPLSSLVDVNPKYQLARGSLVPYVEMSGLPTKEARVTQRRLREFTSGSRFRNGDVLVARITPCLENGKTALVDFLESDVTAWGSTEFLVLRPHEPIPAEYVYCLSRSDAFRDYAVGSMNGSSGRQRVPVEALERLPIVQPPDGLLRAFGQVARSAVALMAENDRQSESLAALRDGLLPKLLSGEMSL
jgi:type I restriction enzyme, S subunit